MPDEAKEEPAMPAVSVGKSTNTFTNTSFLLESELNRTFSTNVQNPRAEEITCVHAVDEENGAASMYCCARNGMITKRQLGKGDVSGVLAGHPGWASCALVVEDSIFVGSDDGKVREWEMSSGKFTRTLDSTRARWADGKPAGVGSHAGLIVCMLAPQNGAAKTLFCGCNDGAVIVWDLADGGLKNVARDAAGHARSVRVLHDCPFDGSVFTGSNDSSIGKWDAFAGSRLWDLKPMSGWASCLLTWVPGQFLLVGCEDGSIKRRGLRQGESQQVSYVVDSLGKAHGSAVCCLVALQGPNWLFSGAGDGSIRKWNVETGELLLSLEGHQGSLMCMLACPAEEILMTGASDATLRQWSMKTGKLLHTSQVPQGHVTGYLVTDKSVHDSPRAGAFGGLSMPTRASFVPVVASTDADKSRMKWETNGMYSRDQSNQLVVRSPGRKVCQLIQVTAALVHGESPGTCDNCGRSVHEGEWLYECSDSNWWHCTVCLPVFQAQPPAAADGPGPFPGWMKTKFPVSAVMDKVKADVRERIQRPDVSPAMMSQAEAQWNSGELLQRMDLNKDHVIDQSELAQALSTGQIAAPAGGSFQGGQPASSSGAPASQTYYVSNLLLQTTAPGLGYRQSADLEDKFPDKRQARWGQVVTAVDMGNGFARTTTGVIGYLPMTVHGHKVLIPSSELQGVAG
jgi:WD40 repeat protein